MTSFSMCVNRIVTPAIAASLLMGLAAVSNAQSFTFTTTNNSTGTNQSTGSGPNTINGTGSSSMVFTNTPDGTATFINPPTNIVPFRIVPVFTAPATNPGVGNSLVTNFNDTFSLTITINSSGSTGSTTFTGLNFSGPLTATFQGVGTPNTIAGYSFSDSVSFAPLSASAQAGQIVNVGGIQYLVQLVSFTNPGNPNGGTPEGNIGGRITAVPEPGSIALLTGMGISGAGFLVRRRKSVSRAV